ncbi:MAG: hypothetical protein ACOC6F_03965, partial [bacterium]
SAHMCTPVGISPTPGGVATADHIARRRDGCHQPGHGAICAIERDSPETTEPGGPIERGITWLLLPAYRRRLRAIVASVPTWVSGEILNASHEIDDQRPSVRLSDN